MRPALSMCVGLVVCGCALAGCSRTFASLPRPVLFGTGGLPGNCTSNVAIDARGDIWTEGGCEASSSGVVHRGRLTDSQRKAFQTALEAVERVPDAPMENLPPCQGQPFEHVSLVRDGAGDRDWYMCTQADGRRRPPFDAAFGAMNAP